MSLSSLLNPSTEAESSRVSPSRENPSLAVHHPSDQNVSASDARRSSQSHIQQQHSTSTSTDQEAAQALAALSESPAPPPTQWYGYNADYQSHGESQQPSDRRPSTYGDPIQLPPLSANGAAPRKMSSPTLEQYHVASRSPEQRRASVISPDAHSNFTLPPLQGFSAPSDQTRRPPHASPSASHADSSQAHHSAIGEERGSSPAAIKEEAIATPQPSSPIDARKPEMEQHLSRTVSSLKNEHGTRTQSPLRESSVPVPTTEVPTAETQPVASKKRPAPSKTKKGTATTMKKAPPSKKRKLDAKGSAETSQRSSKPSAMGKGSSLKGTPANSSPVPSARSDSGDPEEQYDDDDDEDGDEEQDTDLYCICRKTDNGTFMIGCDGTCDDWFHGKCVGIAERDKNLIDKYLCPNCTQAGIGRTSWKRMCRRGGCRQAARVGKTKTGGHGSKYCSGECGVLYFRDMVSRTRGKEESSSSRSARRKGGADTGEDDLGSRGGALAAGEVKALMDASTTVDEFRKLGDGVLSPPPTPDGKDQVEKGSEFTETEEKALQRIQTEKEGARSRHVLLKDRMRFVTLVKQHAGRMATAKELKPKDFCGYDARLEWTEETFRKWRNSAIGQAVFEQDTLAVDVKAENGDTVMEEQDLAADVCDRKKCARHLEWSKLAVDDLRFEMGDNGDRMRALDREEKGIRERAVLRAKAGNSLSGEGTVEIHGLDTVGGGVEDGGNQDAENQDGKVATPLPLTPQTNSVPAVPVEEAVEPMVVDEA